MRDNRQITGRRGEDEACRYLRDRGHEIMLMGQKRDPTPPAMIMQYRWLLSI